MTTLFPEKFGAGTLGHPVEASEPNSDQINNNPFGDLIVDSMFDNSTDDRLEFIGKYPMPPMPLCNCSVTGVFSYRIRKNFRCISGTYADTIVMSMVINQILSALRR